MEFNFRRHYCGSIKAVIFDWAGTTCDFGCMAPAAVFIEVFLRRGIKVTSEQAREPMGMHKKDHIRAMAQMEPIATQWRAKFGAVPSEPDVESLFQQFVPMQLEAIGKHADVIPGTVECVNALRTRGLKIGATTGYNVEMMNVLATEAKRQGYAPDVSVAVTEVPAGRPAPWMALECAKRLGVYPVESIVKVGDTPADIGEGLNAGMWTVGVVQHGNEVGLTEAELAALDAADRAARFDRAQNRLAQSGAHYVVATIAEIPAVVDVINARLARGEKP